MSATASITTKYISGISVHIPEFGRLFAGHFSPVHKEPLATQEVRDVFKEHDIVIGDFNALTRQLKTFCLYDSKWSSHSPPSYLPNIPRPPVRFSIPCFDAIYARQDSYSVKAGPIDLFLLLVVNGINPRELIASLGGSDHAPVLAVVRNLVSGISKTVMTWNVADPVFWSRFYSSSKEGFSLEHESQRQDGLFERVASYIRNYDVVALQEVPVDLAVRLTDSVGDDVEFCVSEMHCSDAVGDSSRSRTVVFWK